MYWPSMTAELKEYISHCEKCSKYEARQQKESLISHEVAERPWEKIGTDLYNIDGQDYLVVVDYFSNFWEIEHLPNTTTSTIIKKLKYHFARQGIPDIVISDNGPQFACEKFSNFASEWDFEHRPGSPGHQQTNGKAEAAVKEAKRPLWKAKDTKSDLYLAVLAHRNTPTESMGTSPAQGSLGRWCKTQLLATKELLKSQSVPTETVKKTLEKESAASPVLQQRDTWPFTKEESAVVRMRPFRLGQQVWEQATVTKRHDERSYEVETEKGTYWRNKADLQEQPTPQRSLQQTPSVKQTPEQTPSDTPLKDQGTIQAEANSTPETAGPKQQTTPVSVPQHPNRTIREPAYLRDYVR